jgi:hypothetical protein
MKAVSQKEHETIVKEEGSSRRNITRKKGGNESVFDSKKKKQGGAGYVRFIVSHLWIQFLFYNISLSCSQKG